MMDSGRKRDIQRKFSRGEKREKEGKKWSMRKEGRSVLKEFLPDKTILQEMYQGRVLVQPDWVAPRISEEVSTGCVQGLCHGGLRSQLLTCRFGCARVGEAPVGLSTVSSCKLQAHSWFRLIFPSRLRWSLSYSALKRKRRRNKNMEPIKKQKEKW